MSNRHLKQTKPNISDSYFSQSSRILLGEPRAHIYCYYLKRITRLFYPLTLLTLLLEERSWQRVQLILFDFIFQSFTSKTGRLAIFLLQTIQTLALILLFHAFSPMNLLLLTSNPKIQHSPLFCAAGLIVAPTQAPKKIMSLHLLLTGPSDQFSNYILLSKFLMDQ